MQDCPKLTARNALELPLGFHPGETKIVKRRNLDRYQRAQRVLSGHCIEYTGSNQPASHSPGSGQDCAAF